MTPTALLYARDYYTNLEKILNRYWNLETTGVDEEMKVENNQTGHKYTFTYPGISPERVSVRLRADKATVDIYVDNKLQRTIAPHLWAAGSHTIGYHGGVTTALSEENIKVTMEHGLLTVLITPEKKASASESVELPINGKKFLRETNPVPHEL
jgi:HSP20 family molecular chaperone IbpA